MIARNWEALGIRVNLRTEPFNTLVGTLYNHKAHWQALIMGWIYGPNFYPTGLYSPQYLYYRTGS